MSYKIFTDSSANLTDAQIERYDIEILSLFYYVGEKEFRSYQKGVRTNLQPCYELMRQKERITTSCPDAASCESAFDAALSAGFDILYIGFSSALSATYQTASGVLRELAARYPERTAISVDTLSASLGEGMSVIYAARMREAGRPLEETAGWVERNKLRICHWFTVDDLFFLKRGGRIPTATALLGSMIGIKPVMRMDNCGRLVSYSKVRGRKNSIRALAAEMEKAQTLRDDDPVFITHGDCIEDAEWLASMVREKFGQQREIVINYVDPVVGAHSGPGTLALFRYASGR